MKEVTFPGVSSLPGSAVSPPQEQAPRRIRPSRREGRGAVGRGGREDGRYMGTSVEPSVRGGGRVRVLPGIQATRSGTRRTVRYLSAEASAGGDLDQHH